MYPSAMEQIYKWKRKPNKKPLIIHSARQVGKTWLMREFDKIAFDNNSQMKELFSADMRTSRIVTGLRDLCRA